MTRTTTGTRVLLIASLVCLPTIAMASGLDSFLSDVDVRATADLGSFKADLSLTFGVSTGKVDGLFTVLSKPSDVYMCLRVGEVAKQPIDRVVEEYKRSKGQGWGAIAKNLGIEPGSAQFHELKEGRLPAADGSAGAKSKGGKKGRG